MLDALNFLAQSSVALQRIHAFLGVQNIKVRTDAHREGEGGVNNGDDSAGTRSVVIHQSDIHVHDTQGRESIIILPVGEVGASASADAGASSSAYTSADSKTGDVDEDGDDGDSVGSITVRGIFAWEKEKEAIYDITDDVADDFADDIVDDDASGVHDSNADLRHDGGNGADPTALTSDGVQRKGVFKLDADLSIRPGTYPQYQCVHARGVCVHVCVYVLILHILDSFYVPLVNPSIR